MESLQLCNDCGWMGEEEDCIRVESFGDTEPHLQYLQCPKCGGSDLIELMGKSAVLEPVLV